MSKRGPGRPFQPGQSGNPGGRVANQLSVAEVLRRKLSPDERADMLIELAQQAEDERVRLQARLAIIERTDGKVKDTVDLNHSGVSPTQAALLDALRLTPHERRKKLAEAQGEAAAPTEADGGSDDD